MGKFDKLLSFVSELEPAAKQYSKNAATVDDIIKIKNDSGLLHHSTNAKAAKDIEKYGLLPQQGKIVESTYGSNSDWNGEGLKDITHFSDEGLSPFYSLWSEKGKAPNYETMTLNEASKKGHGFIHKPDYESEAFYKKIDDSRNGTVKLGGSGEVMSVDDLPTQVERGDVFTEDIIKPTYSLNGANQIEYVVKTDPSFIEMLGEKQQKFLNSIKDLPSDEFQAKLKAAMKADKALGVGMIPLTNMDPTEYLKSAYGYYDKLKNMFTDPLAEQLDLTKDKSAKEGIKSTLNMAADPINLVPGPAGLALGLGQAVLTPEDEAKNRALDKLMRGE